MMHGVRLALVAALVSCGTPPRPREAEPAASKPLVAASAGGNPCGPGDLAPTSAGKPFEGLARHARCRDELLQIMKATSGALGVPCEHCHEKDFSAPTRNKEVANWMATKFAPSLKLRGGSTPTCADCHAEGGTARAKILGHPRRHDLSVEWMTAVLVERFETREGEPLYCRTCHQAGLGDPGFSKKVILTDRPFSPVRDGQPNDG